MSGENLSRRGLLRASALGAGAVLTTGAGGPVAKLAGKTAIVIGSGFGGAVAAYRLGQAGVRTTVLERGRRWHGVTSDAIATHQGKGLNVLSGIGVGGGSLFGAAMSQPRRSEWDQVYPADLPYSVMEETYWPRARQNLGVSSVDRSYLAWAGATGNVIIQALHEVTEIRALAQGGFEVTCKQLDTFGDVLAWRKLPCDFLFMAAGAFHTTSLLVTARAKGWLPRLRPAVGQGFGNNGDFLVAWLNLRKETARAHGWPGREKLYDDANPHVSAAALTFEPFAARTWGATITANLITSMAPERGEIRYDAAAGAAEVYWPYGVMETRGEKAGKDLATRLWWKTEASKGRAFTGVPAFERNLGQGAANTWHPLGGMVMGQSTDFGGKSLDYPNLFCVDGALLPGTACLASPALTITANAERCLDRFIAEHG